MGAFRCTWAVVVLLVLFSRYTQVEFSVRIGQDQCIRSAGTPYLSVSSRFMSAGAYGYTSAGTYRYTSAVSGSAQDYSQQVHAGA